MPKDFRKSLNVLACYHVGGDNETCPHYDAYNACEEEIIFTKDDLLLGSRFHNRPLFVTGFIHEQKTKRILMDNRSVVKIIPLRTIK